MCDTYWIPLLEEAMGWPDFGYVCTALNLWANSEGLPDYAHNWLAEETYDTNSRAPDPPYSAPFYSGPNGVGDGISALYNFLQGSNYNEIRAAFKQGTDIVRMFNAINSSPWCAGCQGGHYPIQLWNYIGGSGPLAPPGSPQAAIDAETRYFQSQEYGWIKGWDGELQGWVAVGSTLVYDAIDEALFILGNV